MQCKEKFLLCFLVCVCEEDPKEKWKFESELKKEFRNATK